MGIRRTKPVPEPEDPPVSPWDDGSERERIVAWRRAELERVGLPYPLALRIAVSDVDLHRAVALIEAGCSPELAVEILL